MPWLMHKRSSRLFVAAVEAQDQITTVFDVFCHLRKSHGWPISCSGQENRASKKNMWAQTVGRASGEGRWAARRRPHWQPSTTAYPRFQKLVRGDLPSASAGPARFRTKSHGSPPTPLPKPVVLAMIVRGDDSARRPNSIPPSGVARGEGRGGRVLLIPVMRSEFAVDGGGAEQNDGNESGTSRSGRRNML